MILAGTEHMDRYPDIPGCDKRGIPTYGTVVVNGQRAYKVSQREIERIRLIGWHCVGSGTSYIYVAKSLSHAGHEREDENHNTRYTSSSH